MPEKKKGQVKTILITECDGGFTIDYPNGVIWGWEAIGILEIALLMRKADITNRYQKLLSQEQEEAK